MIHSLLISLLNTLKKISLQVFIILLKIYYTCQKYFNCVDEETLDMVMRVSIEGSDEVEVGRVTKVLEARPVIMHESQYESIYKNIYLV